MSSFDSTSSAVGPGGGGSASVPKEEATLAEVQASREICLKKYHADIEVCKQKCVKLWKDAEDDSVTESEFNMQLNRVADEGMIRPDDKICSYIRIFLKNDYKALNGARVLELNRLTDVQRRLEAKLNEADDGILSQVRDIVPGYERVIQGDDAGINDNLLRINKLIEAFMLQQGKQMEEMNRRMDNLECKLTKDLSQRIDKLEHRLTSGDIREVSCTFSSQGDTNGVLHFIGSKGGTAPYTNPHNAAGGVVASASSAHHGTVDAIVGRDNAVFNTNNAPNSYIKVDLGVGRRLILNHYSFKHGYDTSGYFIRSWRLEGSNDDSTWVSLKEHNNDSTINHVAYAPGSWSVDNPSISCRYFRILNTSPNIMSNNSLVLCCLELYGTYTFQANPVPFYEF